MAPKQGYASIGVDVKIGNHTMNFVTQIGDIGGTPDNLESTCLKDTMKHGVLGVQDVGNFEVTYLFDNSDADSDYRVLHQMTGVVDIEITLPDGTKFASKGELSNRVSGISVNNLISAVAALALAQDWQITDPA